MVNDRVSLKKQLKLLSLAVNQSSEGIAVIDLYGNLEYSNNAFAKMHGYSAEELVGKKISIFHTPEQMPHVEAVNLEIKQTGSFKGEIWHVKRDGTVFPTIMHNSLILDEANKPIGIMGTLRDISDIKQTDEALRESENKYRKLYEDAAIGIFHSTFEGRFLDVNPSLARMLGYETPQEVVDSIYSISEQIYVEPQVRDEVINRTLAQGGTVKVENLYRRKDGSEWDAYLYLRSVSDPNGQPICFEGFVEDITERKQAEDEREQVLSKLQTTLDATADGILVVDMHGKIVLFNKRFATMWKLQTSILNSQDDGQILPLITDQLKNPDTFLTKVKKLYADPLAKSFDTIDFNDGRIFERYSRPHLLNDEVVGRVWSFRDVTDRKLAEAALEKAKKQWETTFDAMSDWVCIINKDHEIIQSNKACESIINLSVDQVVGMHCYDIVHGMDVHILDCPLQKAIKSNRMESMEFKTGDNRWLQITVEPIETRANNDRFVHIVRDITELKERENEITLLQKEKAFSILSGGIAHDYNNLLTIIWGNICLLKEEMTHPSQQELLNDVDKACRQARDLTHQFITLSHVALLKKTSYNIEDILSSAIEKASEAKNIEISMDIKDKIPAIELDPEGLKLAFENIICNAVEAMPDGGRLEILVKKEIVIGQKDESLIKIFFKDSGVGISIHDIDSVFDPYFTTKELSIQKGGGLGLAVSQSIVRKHGGNVRINSKLGQGTTIIVTLPITDLKQIVSSDQKDSLPLKKSVILLMEDDPALRKLITKMLKNFNCEVFSTSHGKAAIEVFFNTGHKNILIDIVLLDQNIKGGMGGIETLKNLREYGFSGKAIVVTGSPFSPAIIDFEKYGFDANLLKPFSKEDFKSVIEKFVSL